MRATPHDVHAWFVGSITDDVLDVYLGTLQADPNWSVTSAAGVALRTFGLLYGPTGDLLDIRLLRVDETWMARVRRIVAA